MTYPRRVVVALGEPRPPRPPRAVVTVDGRSRPDARVSVAPSGALVVTVPAVPPELTPTARLSDGPKRSQGSGDTGQGVLSAPEGAAAPGIGNAAEPQEAR